MADADEMRSQCDEPLPPEALESLRLFNAGEYYKQHDLFEALWRDEPDMIRNLYQGILQIGVGYYQITLGNALGAAKMLLRGERWLATLPDECRGVNIARLRSDAAAALAELRRLGADRISEFDRGLLKPVEYESE